MARGQAGAATPCGQSTQTSLCCLLHTVSGDTWGERVWPQRQASRISAKLSVFQEAFLDHPPPPSGTALLAASAPVLPSPTHATPMDATGLLICHATGLWFREGRNYLVFRLWISPSLPTLRPKPTVWLAQEKYL